MPQTKNAQLRYYVLDQCFSNFYKQYEIDDLIDAVNKKLYEISETSVAERQIREDISFMRETKGYNAPIKTYPTGEGRRCYYRYADRGFSIYKNELSVEEVETLRETIKMLGKYRGAAGNAWLEEVISNLEYRFGVKPNSENIVAFDQNTKLTGIEFLSDLIDLAVSHTPIEVTYRTYKGKEMVSVVHPYHLKQYNSRWFLLGHVDGAERDDQFTNMALDRIVKYKRREDIKFVPNTRFDFATMFDEIVGVSIPKDDVKKERVVLRFDGERFPYVKSKPIHPSQEVVSESEGTVSLMVRHNKELETQIFSYMPHVEVLEPEWLREKFAGMIEENLKKYRN